MTKVTSHKKKIIEQLGPLKGTTVLDYGCGRGEFIELLLAMPEGPSMIYAVDSSLDVIHHIKQHFVSDIVKALVCKSPRELSGMKYDKIICHNVLECVKDKVDFINQFEGLLAKGGVFVLSHHDFDSAVYNNTNKELTRQLVLYFADTKQAWQEYSDGQMGRKIPGLVDSSVFKNHAKCETWRIVEREFKPGNYGFLMADMIMDIAKNSFEPQVLKAWRDDSVHKANQGEYYFAIDLVVAVVNQ